MDGGTDGEANRPATSQQKKSDRWQQKERREPTNGPEEKKRGCCEGVKLLCSASVGLGELDWGAAALDFLENRLPL